MFVRYYSELALPMATVEQALLEEPENWIPGVAEEAGAHGWRLLADVGFHVGDQPVSKRVCIDIGAAARAGAALYLPITWRAAGARTFFPDFEGSLELAPLRSGSTQISLNAFYEPPLGAAGRSVDRALLHRAAEATIKEFVDGVSGRLLERCTAAPRVG